MKDLQKILSKQLALYREYKQKEESGEVDDSYIYDMAYEWFNELSRGDFQAILEIVTKEE